MASTPGLLFVTMQPADDLPVARFHEWYNNEHGPTRLRLPYFQNGFRYRVKNGSKPQYMAMYEVEDVEMLKHESYTHLRDPSVKSARETETMAKVSIDRRIYERLYLREVAGVSKDYAATTVLGMAVSQHAYDNHQMTAYLEPIENTSNWVRTKVYRKSSIDEQHEPEVLVLYEFNDQASDGTTFDQLRDGATAIGTHVTRGPWTWEHFYTFGPAPRDLESLANQAVGPFTSNDGTTKTLKSPRPAIESYVTLSDGAVLPYRLEGATSPSAPVIVLVNSILVNWGIWDDFVDALLERTTAYRVLRFDSRGRTKDFGTTRVTLDVLVADLLGLLDALLIEDVAMAVGVSLGGATVLSAALKHPGRIPAFVACDTNAKAPQSNPQSWNDRISVAEKEGATSADREIVGDELAEMTVRRWFVKSSYDGAAMEHKIARVKNMVRDNDLDGFRSAVKALYEYDMTSLLNGAVARGTFVVGEGDGVLPNTMREMASQYGNGAKLEVIPSAGHLPMIERPIEVVEAIVNALQDTRT